MFDYIFGKIKSTIFSKITPFQLLLTSLFAFVFGFIPGISYSPLLFVGVLFLVIILRINIGVFIFISIIAKALSFLLESVSFSLGQFLLDGFTQPIFKSLVNTPVVAYAGFDYYLVAGAFVLSIILGLVFGVVIAKLYKKIVAKMSAIQTGTEIYNKITKNFFVKIASWIFLGKNVAKIDWVKMKNRKFRQPFRITGVILVGLIIATIAYAPQILETSLVSNIIKQQLTKANGATVDYDSLKLDLTDARLQITNLGAADPLDLNKDRFYAKSISSSINISNLLTRQIALKDVIVEGVSLDKQRKTKGELYLNDTKPISDEEAQQASEAAKKQTIENIKKIGGDLQQVDLQKLKENAKEVKDVAINIKEAVEFLSSFRSDNAKVTDSQVKQQVVTPKEQAKVYGYANVRNESLRDKYPNFVVQNIDVKDYKDGDTLYDATITNISTNPELLGKSTEINIKSTNNKNLNVGVVISNKPNVNNTVRFDLANVAGDAIKGLTVQGVGLDADSLDVAGNGTWQFSGVRNVTFDIPLQLKFKNVGVNFNQFKQKVSDLTLKGAISGDLNNVSFGLDTSSLKNLVSVDTVKNTASQIAKQTGLDKKANQVLEKTKINGKSIKDLNAQDIKNINPQDVKNLASSFGVQI
ncbi:MULTISPECIES: TIGR03546 family protein [unclassified Francisella]|uniref:TIGR03546 family protein n=1 Tax=unclassified Francisella TaxID=2610885 RepID=UPI002E31A5AF|nr:MULTISPECIES: TIGR03546 family protein [unclassified Francisella]MED7819470.1 TIGR03546 family protein [Francisella sp. 19S2-4]MED7830259.1 TIGR03546 family protein [Francisella sp. 19S2-10]